MKCSINDSRFISPTQHYRINAAVAAVYPEKAAAPHADAPPAFR
jgi:hypothetical protein